MFYKIFRVNKRKIAMTLWVKLFLAIIFFIILNAIFQWMAIDFGYKRYFIGAELLLAVLIFGFVNQWLGFCAFFFAVILEVAIGLTGVFHFMHLQESLDLLEFTFLARRDYIFLFGSLFAMSVLCFLVSGRYVSQARSNRIGLLMSLVVAGLTYSQWVLSMSGENFFTPVHAERSALLFGSAAYIFQNSLDLNRVKQAVNGDPDIEYRPIRHPSAAQLAIKEGFRSSRILFIVNEAWGLPKDSFMLENQIKALRINSHITNIKLESVYARGATAAGELRELCGLIPSRMNFGKMTPELVGECLPAKLRKEGYETVAIHGADSGMYRRSRWYPVLGFEKIFFKEDLPATNVKCFSFPGYCDRYIFPLLESGLKKRKIFIYWLTLNTHIPYDRRDVVAYREDICQSVLGADYNEMLCNYQNLHVQFFEEMARFLKSEVARGLEVIVVGDHPPIFLDDDSRKRFVSDQVPMLHFVVQ